MIPYGVIYKIGKKLLEQYRTYANTETDLSALQVRLEASLLILDGFQALEQDKDGLPDHQQQRITHIFTHLQGIYDRLKEQQSQFPLDPNDLNVTEKLHWTLWHKSRYKAILQDMEVWENKVQGVIQMIQFLRKGKNGNCSLYNQLFEKWGGDGVRCAEEIRVDADARRNQELPLGLEPTDCLERLLEGSNPDDLKDEYHRMVSDEGRPIFVEYRYYAEEPKNAVRNLALSLRLANPASMHILRCKGMIYQGPGYERSVLFYEMPGGPIDEMNWTLAKAIEGDQRAAKLPPPLDIRVRYAVEISMAVMFTHSAGLVHESIRPDNILLLRNSSTNNGGHEFSAYLVGFNAARSRDPTAYSAQRAETDPLKRLYQHPERQVLGKVVRCGIRHDMYSLGVVLLELAMWGHIQSRDMLGSQDLKPSELQERLIEQAKSSVAGLAGTKYMEAVLCCLHGTSEEEEDERNLKTREMFYERVMQPLRQMVL